MIILINFQSQSSSVGAVERGHYHWHVRILCS